MKSKSSAGFTLIELLVSAFIIALISGIFMVNYHSTNKRSELGVAKQRLASDIRVAQNNSLAAKDYNGANVWGVYFDLGNPTKYIIFVDKEPPDGDKLYEAGEAVETKNLPAGIIINFLSPVSHDNGLDIVFEPPSPITYVNGFNVRDSQAKSARIVLKENTNNSTAAVTVNLFGLIDAE